MNLSFNLSYLEEESSGKRSLNLLGSDQDSLFMQEITKNFISPPAEQNDLHRFDFNGSDFKIDDKSISISHCSKLGGIDKGLLMNSFKEDESMKIFQGEMLFQNTGGFKKWKVGKSPKINAEREGKNLIFEHLKILENDSVSMRSQPVKEDDKFKKFLTEKKLNFSNTKSNFNSVESSQNIKFGFCYMKNKDSITNISDSNSTEKLNKNWETNFGYQIFNKSFLSHESNSNEKISGSSGNFPDHVDISNIQPVNLISQTLTKGLSSRRRKRNIFSKRDLDSMQNTGLRATDLMIGEIIEKKCLKSPGKTMTLVNLSKLFQQSPLMKKNNSALLNIVNKSIHKSRKFISKHSIKAKKFENDLFLSDKKNKIIEENEIWLDNGPIFLGKRPSELFESSIGNTPIRNTNKINMNVQTLNKKNKIKVKKTVNKKKHKHTGCKCKKTKCTRLHCICFRERGYCGPECGCLDCLNREEYADTIKKVRDFTKEINPLAFKSKIQVVGLKDGKKIHNRGCSCSKNNCMKNYCECHKNGLACSPLCKCEGCKNEKIDLNAEEVKKIFKKCSRKKKKFVISLEHKEPQLRKIHI